MVGMAVCAEVALAALVLEAVVRVMVLLIALTALIEEPLRQIVCLSRSSFPLFAQRPVHQRRSRSENLLPGADGVSGGPR